MVRMLRDIGCPHLNFTISAVIKGADVRQWGVSSSLFSSASKQQTYHDLHPTLADVSVVVSHLNAARTALGLLRQRASARPRAALIVEDDVDFAIVASWQNRSLSHWLTAAELPSDWHAVQLGVTTVEGHVATWPYLRHMAMARRAGANRSVDFVWR